VLGVTGLITWLNRGVPKSVVRGLQLALGLTLLMRALQMIAGTHRMFGLDSYFNRFGGMPMCHGAGGLGGQYRFGARTNGSILILGGAKMSVTLLSAPR